MPKGVKKTEDGRLKMWQWMQRALEAVQNGGDGLNAVSHEHSAP